MKEPETSWGAPLKPVYGPEDVAAERGYVDEVIMPRDTRARLCAALELLRTKRDSNPPKKHGNIPL